MASAELLIDAFGRIRDGVHGVLDGLPADHLSVRLDADANPICWLVWHLTRVQDDHVAAVADLEQRWTADGWAARFGLPLTVDDIGYGHRSDQVASVAATAGDLLGYFDAVDAQTVAWLGGLGDGDLTRIVDDRWDPPVTLAVRLVSVVADDLEHLGQAEYVRGILERR